jgi:hypothetical protein
MRDEPVHERRDHVARSMLPWRSDALTECGRATSDVANVITLDQLDARIRRDGTERAVLTVCMKCWQTGTIAARWDSNAVGVIAREAVRAGIGDREPSSRPEARRFRNELHAIAALVTAHRDEFDAFLAALESTVSMSDHRRAAGGFCDPADGCGERVPRPAR